MRKSASVFIALLICIAPAAFGQQNKLNIGISAGPDYSLLYGFKTLSPVSRQPLLGVSGGISVQYNLPKTVSFLTGVFYETKGQRIKGLLTNSTGATTGEYKYKMVYNYITVPLLAKITFDKKNIFFVEGGGFASYLTGAHNKFLTPPLTGESDVTQFYNRVDFGVTLGLGVNVPLTEKLVLSIEARNNLGLHNISALPLYNNGSIKTNSANLLISLAYKLGKRA